MNAVVARASAYLIALFAINIAVPIIDFFSLPVPRYIAGFSLSAVFAFVAGLLLAPSVFRVHPRLINKGEAMFLLLLLFWGLIEFLRGEAFGDADYDFVLFFLPPVFAAVLTRWHLQLWEDPSLLIESFVRLSFLLGFGHLLLLSENNLGLALLPLNEGELFDKNGISILMAISVWLLAVLDSRKTQLGGLWFACFFVFTAVHIEVNHARAAGIVLCFSVLMFFLRRLWPVLYIRVSQGLPLLGAALMVTMALGHFFVSFFSDVSAFAGSGDDQISFLSRLGTNAAVIARLVEEPVLGIGAQAVANIRSFGYVSHTLYLMLAGAYGIIGLLPLLGGMALWLFSCRGDRRFITFQFLFLVILLSSFFNDHFICYGFLFSLVDRIGRQGQNGS